MGSFGKPRRHGQGKRAYLSKVINPPKSAPNRDVVGEYADRSKEYQRSMAAGEELPLSVRLTEGKHREILDKYREITASLPLGPGADCRVVKKNQYRTVRLFYTRGYSQCVFVEENYEHRFIQRSIVYTGRERAMLALQMDSITYVVHVKMEVTPIHSL